MALEIPANEGALSTSAYTVIVADDQVNIRDFIERVLERRMHCAVRSVENGDEVLAELAKVEPDVLITDMMMPGLHGLELITAARKQCPGLAIIAMTGYAADFPYVKVVQAGATDFIHKPFQPAELEAKLLRIFRERKTHHAQHVAETKYRNLFELSMDGMLIVDAQTHRISDANNALVEIAGRSLTDLRGQPLMDLFDQPDQVRLEQWLTLCEHSGKGTLADLTVPTPEGKRIHVDVTVTFIAVNAERLIFFAFKDVTDKVQVEQQLADAAQRDALTGLFNKRSFQNRIEAAVARARNKQIPLSLLFLDLDNFKHCNDTYGHQAGDKLLVAVGETIDKSVRTTRDEGFRLGGDEFAVLLLGADRENSLYVAERIQSEFRKYETLGTTMSIGIVQYTEDLQVETFMRAADEALYKAKGAGKDTIHLG
ncbi:MAG: diguanylate cyclase [Candidatus Hydrogenedentota bacterium]